MKIQQCQIVWRYWIKFLDLNSHGKLAHQHEDYGLLKDCDICRRYSGRTINSKIYREYLTMFAWYENYVRNGSDSVNNSSMIHMKHMSLRNGSDSVNHSSMIDMKHMSLRNGSDSVNNSSMIDMKHMSLRNGSDSVNNSSMIDMKHMSLRNGSDSVKNSSMIDMKHM